MTLSSCKRFLTAVAVVSLIAYTPAKVAGCGSSPSFSASRYPAFQFVDTPAPVSLSGEINSETINFWRHYTNNKVSRDAITDFLNTATAESVRKRTGKNPFLKYLVEGRHVEALKFLELSLSFNAAQRKFYDETWDYERPDLSSLAAFADKLTLPPITNPLFDRYLFLDIRANAAAHRYEEVIRLWERYGADVKDEALKARMEGYLGGAYYHTKRYVDAISIFAANGDTNSLNWCLAHMVGTDNLSRLFEADPNSVAVEYVLQDYMNYLWLLKLNRANEYSFPMPGNPYRNGDDTVDKTDLDRECSRFITLANHVLRDKRVKYPMMWETAKAFALNMMGRGNEASTAIEHAGKLDGTSTMADNLTRVRFWIDLSNLDEHDTKEVKSLADRYNTLYNRAAGQSGLASQAYGNTVAPQAIADYTFLADFIIPYLSLQYRDTPRYSRVLAMMEGVKRMENGEGYWSFDPTHLLTSQLPAAGVSALVQMLHNPDRLNALDAAILSSAQPDTNPLYDALGRIEMAHGNYGKAIGYFDRIDPYWIARQNYYPFLCRRTIDKTKPFARHQTSYQTFDSIEVTAPVNYRADYCRTLARLKQQFDDAIGEAKAVAGYEYASALFQASAQGDLWALADNGWSAYEQADALSQRADSVLLQSLAMTSDPATRGRILYGIAAITPSKESGSTWSLNEGRDNKNHYRWETPSETQLMAYRELGKLYPTLTDPYIKGCDMLKAYIADAILPARKEE
ncbi:MAG: hypothetical protein K1V84_10150 [Muribaculaceae bacterium]